MNALISICLTILLFASVVNTQGQIPVLEPNKTRTFQLLPDEGKSFRLQLKRDGFAEITWLANKDVMLVVGVFDSSGKELEITDSNVSDSLYFVAPNDGDYFLFLQFDKSSEIGGQQTVSVEYEDSFRLPPRAKLKDSRVIAGFTVKIVNSAETEESIVMIEKAGRLKKILKEGGGANEYIGFSFPDPKLASTAQGRRSSTLIRSTLDKTGDGVPDVMLDYFSGGAHCCFSTYFLNLGDVVDLVEVINTENAGMLAIGKNPQGGLRFSSNENAFAYWNIHFAGSPLPEVILEFENGVLTPNFMLMKKPPPSLASLKSKARVAQKKINLDRYTEVSIGEFEEAFWSEMLDLIYTGNETLAWQYFDLVWPNQKPGREQFLADFKEQLASTYYGAKTINVSNSLRNFMRAFEKQLQRSP